MKSSYIRLISSTRELVKCQLSHEDEPGKNTLFAEMSYNRITGDFHITWCYECPLSLVTRLSETLKFVKLCGQV